MRCYKVTFEDGSIIYTDMNATLTEARAYYVGQSFNFGDTDEHPKDKLVKAVLVEDMD